MIPGVVISEGSKRPWLIFSAPLFLVLSYEIVSRDQWWEFYHREYAEWRERDVVKSKGITYDSYLAEKQAECQAWNAEVHRCVRGEASFLSEKSLGKNTEDCEDTLEAVRADIVELNNRKAGIFFGSEFPEPGIRNCDNTRYYGSPPRWTEFLWPASYWALTILKVVGAFVAAMGAFVLATHGAVIPLIKWVIAGFKESK